MGKCFLIFLLYSFSILASSNDTCIIISEVMFYAVSGNNEFIELYNRSETETIDLQNFTIKYYTSKPDTIISAGYGTLLAPKSYAVIFEGDYDFSNGLYKSIVPASALRLKITKNAFGSNGMSNTSNRPLWLINSVNDTIDVYTYSADNKSGYSDEKLFMNRDTSAVNWKNSIKYLGTPGYQNSVIPYVDDLRISVFSSSPNVQTGKDVQLDIKILNDGMNSSSGYIINIYNDMNRDSIPQAGELILSLNENGINSGDSMSVTQLTTNYVQGRNYFIAVLNYTPDDDLTNNLAFTNFNVGNPISNAGNIVINEIMYDPASGETEWVELKNISPDIINLKGWSLSDVLTVPTKAVITDKDYFLSPNELFVAARDSSFYFIHPDINAQTKVVPFGTLGNTVDGVIVYDYGDGIVDSMMYKSSWGHKKGYSIERISDKKSSCDSSNWVLSLSSEKSTPGKENSVVNIPDGSRNDMAINEIMFDPNIGNNEFLEFINLKKDSLNIGGWSIEDQHANKYILSDSNFVIGPDEYFILAADSSVLKGYNIYDYRNKSVLNVSSLGLTTEELVLLKDLRGNVIDSVYYSEKWHNSNFINTKGRSLERINPWLGSNDRYNWNTCVDSKGATPGAKNSIYTNNNTVNSGITVKPNPFSPDNDGYEDCTIINYSLRTSVSQVNIKIYDSHGRLVRVLSNNMASGTTGSVIFDGLGDDRMPLRMGIYIVFLEAVNSSTGADEILKTTVVVARKLK
jgi:hypothetical protein